MCPAGYLGVDMFFVVSGYLITGIISRDLKSGIFSFRKFYLRRARRLLPAAYTMLSLTTVASAILLSLIQFREYVQQLYGSILFAANVVLWQQTGYFAESAYFKPLLHVWSLSLEEQYYMGIPLLLAMLRPRLWLPVIIILSVVSFTLALYLVDLKPSVAFFMLPTRFWELGIGSVGALLTAGSFRRSARAFLAPSIATILLLPWFPLPFPHPGVNALLICAGTLVVILAENGRLSGNLFVSGLAQVGNASYSLYLVHFPIFALARATFISTDLPLALDFALLALTIMSGYALYRWIEVPCRYGTWPAPRIVAGLAVFSLLSFVLPLPFLQAKNSTEKYAAALRPNRGLGCQTAESASRYDPKCTESERPKIIIWGDSLSAHLVPAIAGTIDAPVAQASAGMCTPIVGLAAAQGPNESAFAARCIDYNHSVIAYIGRTPSIDVVVMTGSFLRFFERQPFMVRKGSDGVTLAPVDNSVLIDALDETIHRLRGMGKRVIIVSPPPQAQFDLGRCWERVAEKIPTFGPNRTCALTPRTIAPGQRHVLAMITTVSKIANVPMIRLDDLLCRANSCMTEVNGITLYRDETHFTDEGSLWVGRRFGLGPRVLREAR